jgi:arylsulfatase A-like enzyme
MKSPLLSAFDLSKEKPELRAEYGNTPFGDACLLARRLTETGVSYVEVVLGGWDTHRNNFAAVRNLCRTLDPAMAALFKDLSDRGRLDDTLVLWMGEFGRTPRVNEFEGRDHYARAWSGVVGGAGLHGGKAIGATDEDGEEVAERPVSAQDLLATCCTALGIDPLKENYSPEGRPIKIVKDGKVVKELLTATPAPEKPRAD